ncbi:MAG: hypothetical protein JO036_11055 [Candidatus Eremiobacteraeota bacterium]|nr:hypothetical protein [Candidatus Eremiobacteraeota bacterium]
MRLQMRFPVLIALAAMLVASATARAVASPPTSLDVSASGVDFFYNRFIVTADGNVRVRLSDGTIVSGQTFTMDLKLNRYLVAGDVHLDGPKVHERGAAFAGYPDLDRSYFLPAEGAPERWTYYGLDWSDKHPGREQPGDAFYFPDLTGERPYIYAAGARIVPKTNVLFDQPRVYTAGAYLPLPRYVVTFSANSHFYENGFAGARADVALPFNGSEHSLTALHVRNDQFNGTYLAIDQHFVWPNDWIVASIDPLTQEQRQYNLIGYKRFSPKFEARAFLQESAASPGLINRPINAAGFTEIQLNAGLSRSGLSFTQDNYWQQLLGYRPGANDTVLTANYDPRWREHPSNATLAWTGFENRIFKFAPLLFRLRSGIGNAHDVYGEGGYPNLQPGPRELWYHYTGATLYTAPVRLKNNFSLTASFDKQRTWYSEPHQVDVADTRFSLARVFERQHVNAFVAYETRTTGDYWGAQQLAAYPPGNPNPACTVSGGDVCATPFGFIGGQNAFRGFAISRGATGSVVYTPTAYFGLNLTLAHFTDFPAPVPGLYGQPPWQFTGDLRMRLSKQLLVDVTRQYYFNFANERWTPQLGVQFSP